MKTLYEDDDTIIRKSPEGIFIHDKRLKTLMEITKENGMSIVTIPMGELLPCLNIGVQTFMLCPTLNNDSKSNPKNEQGD